MVPLSYYEIRVAAVLPSEVLLDFDRLETFAVQVIEVRRLHDAAVPPDGERRRA